jgi:hypothetical protein
MKKIFTLLTFLAFTLSGYSQMFLEITAPNTSAGKYQLIRSASFGEQTVRTITQPLSSVLPLNGCTVTVGTNPITNVITGTIALIDRGVCPFVDKALNAQNKGAIAVIICQNSPAAITSPGGTGPLVTVPTFMMSQADCAKVRIDIASGAITGKILEDCSVTYPANAIWGNVPKQGDFDGGLNGWTVVSANPTSWQYTSNSRVTGQFTNTSIVLPSACTGYALFNSDKLNQDTVCAAPCTGTLLSPVIDLTGKPQNNLYLRFSQSLRKFTSTYTIFVSYNGGQTYADTIQVNTDIPTNGSINNTLTLPLCKKPANVTSMRIAFGHVGNFYYWGIDDVMLLNVTGDDGNTAIENNFFATAPYYSTPKTQANRMPFLLDIGNRGVTATRNTNAKVNVKNSPTNVIYTQTKTFPTLACNQIVENQVFADLYQMPSTVGAYQIEYVAGADNNLNKTDDTVRTDFIISEKTFATVTREAPTNQFLSGLNDGVNPAYWESNFGKKYSAGNYFFVPKGKGHKATKVRFGLGNLATTTFAGFVFVDIYKVLLDEDGDKQISPSERIRVGTASDVITNATPNLRNLEFTLLTDAGGEVQLEDNTGYAVIITVEPVVDSDPIYEILSFNSNTTNPFIYYVPTELAFDDKNIFWSSGLIARSVNVPIDDRVFSRISELSVNKAIFCELDVEPVGVNVQNIDASISVKLYPNPTSDVLYADLTLQNNSKKVKTEIYSITGAKVSEQNFTNIKTDKLKLETGSLSAGLFILKVTTDTGFMTQRFVKQ